MNIRNSYEPKSRNHNLTHEVIYVLFTDGHIYHINKDIKSLEQYVKMKKLENIDITEIVCPKPSPYYYLHKQVEEINPILINDYDDFKLIVEQLKDDKNDLYFLYNKYSLVDLYIELFNHGIKANAFMQSSELRFNQLRIKTNKKNIILYCLEEEGVSSSVSFDNIEAFKSYQEYKNFALNHLLSKVYISKYSYNFTLMINRYMKSALIGTFTDIPNDINFIQLDFNRYYTSILNAVKYIPKINSFDEFVDYNNEDIEDHNLYYVEKLNNNLKYPFHKFSLCYGMNIRGISDIRIISHLVVSKLVKFNANDIIKKVYNNNTLTNEMKKNIINHIVGKYNKKSNTKYIIMYH